MIGCAGENCTECDTNFAPVGECDQCLRGCAGENCSDCASNFGPPRQCDQCLRGWTGENCTDCATNFGPAGKCDTCLTGWAGDDCDACADGWLPPTCDQICNGFGCCNHSNCQGCIENGKWEGAVLLQNFEVRLTFSGDTCTQVVSGELNDGLIAYLSQN